MALLGHPGKFTMCLAEDEEVSPFDPWHVSLGFDAQQSTVTVIGTDAPTSVMGVVDADDESSPDRLLESLARGFAHVTTNNTALTRGQAALALNPDHAAVLASAGHDRRSIQEAIVERAVVTGADLMATAGAMRSFDPDDLIACFAEPSELVLIVAGGGGLYSAAFPTWCAGPHANRAVTVEIEVGQACEIPAFADLRPE